MRIFHSRLRLLDDGIQAVSGYKGANHTVDGDGVVGDLAPLLEFALELEGIVWAEISAHTAVLRKSPAFEWDQIMDRMMAMWNGIELAMDATEPAALGPWRAAITDPQIKEFLEDETGPNWPRVQMLPGKLPAALTQDTVDDIAQGV